MVLLSRDIGKANKIIALFLHQTVCEETAGAKVVSLEKDPREDVVT